MKHSISVEIAGETEAIDFPTNEQFQRIANLRDIFSKGHYRDDRDDEATSTLRAMTFFEVMAPKIMKASGQEDLAWLEVTPNETYEFTFMYERLVAPWMDEVRSELKAVRASLEEKLKKIEKARAKAAK